MSWGHVADMNVTSVENGNLEIGILLLAGIVIVFHSFATNISAALRGAFNGVMLILALVAVYLTTIYI